MKASLIVISFAAVVVLALACGGGRSAAPAPTLFEVCTRTVAPLTDEPLTESVFAAADEDLSVMIEAAEAGHVTGAQIAFSQPHNLTHNVDGPLRQVNESLAIRLCNEVVIVEQEMVGDRDTSVLAEQARKIRDLLAEAATALNVVSE